MTKLTPEQISEIRAREQAATEGPWERCQLTDDTVVVAPSLGGDCDGIAMIILPSASPATAFGMDRRIRTANGDFIANARADIPALLSHIAAVEAERAAAQAEAAKLCRLIDQARLSGGWIPNGATNPDHRLYGVTAPAWMSLERAAPAPTPEAP